MSEFLENRHHCNDNLSWSGAFCSRICASINNSSILGFLAEENQNMTNCTDLWRKILAFLRSSTLATAKTTKHWDMLFGLQCEDMSTFMDFYSKFKTQVTDVQHRASHLQKNNIDPASRLHQELESIALATASLPTSRSRCNSHSFPLMFLLFMDVITNLATLQTLSFQLPETAMVHRTLSFPSLFSHER